MIGKGRGSLSDKGIPSLFEAIRGPSRTIRPPTEQGGTFHAQPPADQGGTFYAKPVSVKQEENVRPKATYIPSFPSQPLHRGTSQQDTYTNQPNNPNPHLQPSHFISQSQPTFHSTPHPHPMNHPVVSHPNLTHAQPPQFPTPIVQNPVVQPQQSSVVQPQQSSVGQPQQTFHYPGSDQTVTYPSVPDPFSNSIVNNSLLASSMRVPQLPPFSGENQKGDVSFELWKYELLCCISDAIYPNALILQAVRRSLRGRARETLLTVDSTATPSDILSKLDDIYGIVSSRQNLLQQFYLETQQADESVADYSIRIENLLRRATVSTQLHVSVRHEMLCSKLWNGLRDPLLKNSSRYKFDVTKDFNVLRREIRQIEQDLLTSRHTAEDTKQLQHNVLQNTYSCSTDKKIDNLVEQVKTLKQKLYSIEKKCEDASKTGKDTTSSDSSASSSSFQHDNSSRGRGKPFYHRRGGGRGRGGSGRGSNQKRNDFQSDKKKGDKKDDTYSNPKSNKEN